MNSPMSCPGLLGILSMVSKMSIRSELTFFSFPPFTGAKPLMGASRLQTCQHSKPVGWAGQQRASSKGHVHPSAWPTLLTINSDDTSAILVSIICKQCLDTFPKLLQGANWCQRHGQNDWSTIHVPCTHQHAPNMQMKACHVNQSQLCRHAAGCSHANLHGRMLPLASLLQT